MKKYTKEELADIAQDTFKKTPGAKRLLIAANGTVFREDQADRAAEYSKEEEIEIHPFEKERKAVIQDIINKIAQGQEKAKEAIKKASTELVQEQEPEKLQEPEAEPTQDPEPEKLPEPEAEPVQDPEPVVPEQKPKAKTKGKKGKQA